MRIAWLSLLLVPGVAFAGGAPPTGAYQPYAYAAQARSLAGGHFALQVGGGYNGVRAAGAGLSPDDARVGLGSFGTSVGVGGGVQVDAAMQLGDSGARGFGISQSRAELRVQALGEKPKLPFQLTVGLGYQSDVLREFAITGLVSASGQIGPVDLTANLRLAHYFAPHRDPVDVMVIGGALARATDWLRVGAEYVGEELEEDDDDAAGANVDGGARHLVGPTVAVTVAHDHVRMNVSAGAVISKLAAPGPQVRGSIAYQF